MNELRNLLVIFVSFRISTCSNVLGLIGKIDLTDKLNTSWIYSEDGRLNFTELSSKYIRPAEEHDVISEDGYILKLFHIPGNASNVILFCHGIGVTSDSYIIRGKTSLIYMLAEQGFDVWAMNFRGNRYSRRHVTLNPDTDYEFWQYSVHEIGFYDMKAIIDFILNKTGQKQLSVAAHSEGTTAFFVLASERPEYNKKVKVFVALAPVCYLRDSGPTLQTILKLYAIGNAILKVLFGEEFLGYYSLSKKVIDIICSQGVLGYKLCFNIIGSITGFNPENIEEEFVTTILGHFPAGTSRKNMKHYAQIFHSNKFVHYDYGLKNLIIYGALRPPAYNLKRVTTKVALFAAKEDKIAGLKDIGRVRMALPNVVHYQLISDNEFNHIDYMWGRNAYLVLYPDVIDILHEHS